MGKLYFRLAILTFCLAAFTGHARQQGSAYYVALDGNDENPGSLAYPWKTIRHAAETLTAGDTLYIREGEYLESLFPLHSGSAGSPITYTAYPGETVILNGIIYTIPDETYGWVDISNLSYITISGLSIIDTSASGIRVAGSHHITLENNYTDTTCFSGIRVVNSDYVLVAGNEIVRACSEAGCEAHLTIAGSDTFEVRDNQVHGIVPGTPGNGGISIQDGSSNGLVYRNTVYELNHSGIVVDAYAEHTYNIEVYQNVVHSQGLNGITLASQQGGLLENIRVYDNIIGFNDALGLRLPGAGPLKDIFMVNNTIASNGWDWGGGIYIENPNLTHVVVRNNIVSHNFSFQIVVKEVVPTEQLTVDHNLIYGFRGEPGEIYGTEAVIGNPRFADLSGLDLHLLPGSPAIDSGSDLDAPAFDFDGRLRPQDGNRDGFAGYDLGAYELPDYPYIFFLPLVTR